ncbi:MAG: pyrroloquinoline quinone biosynthesis peptide chaperone PqqD [Kiloniellales bacterium]
MLQVPNGVRLHFDKHRDQWVLLAPERLFVLDAIAYEIVKRCDGSATLAAIVDDLATAYGAPREAVLRDVNNLLQDLANKRILVQ